MITMLSAWVYIRHWHSINQFPWKLGITVDPRIEDDVKISVAKLLIRLGKCAGCVGRFASRIAQRLTKASDLLVLFGRGGRGHGFG